MRTIVGGVLFATDQTFWVEKLSIGPSAYLIDRGGVQIDKDATWNIFATTRLSEESLCGAGVLKLPRLIVWTSIGLETVFQKVAVPCQSISVATTAIPLLCGGGTYSSQALFPSWVPAWPI